jgi:hypothetical protein
MKTVEGNIFSEKKIKEYTQLFKDKVAEVMRLQREGKLPFYKKIPKAVVTTSDIMAITDRSERTAQRIMAKVRKKLGKQKDEYVSVKDFSSATGIDEWSIQRVLDMCT